MKKLLLTISILFISIATHAQDGVQTAGIRFGYSSGLTYKKFVSDNQAFEFLLTARDRGLQITGLYEIHEQIFIAGLDNFFLYYGVGGHIGVDRSSLRFERNGAVRRTRPTLGVDAIAGLEYRIKEAPFVASIEIKPFADLVGFREIETNFLDMALTVKYVF